MKHRLSAVPALLCCAGIIFTCAGCSSSDSTSQADSISAIKSDTASDTSNDEQAAGKIKDVLSQIKESYSENLDSEAYYGDEIFEKNAKKLFAMQLDELADGGIIYAGSGGLADEISIIRLADGDVSTAVSALEARKEMRINDFTGYKPEEVTKIEACEIFSQGDYAVLIISDDAQKIASDIKSMLG